METVNFTIGFRGFDLDGGADRPISGNLEIVIVGNHFEIPEQLRALSRLFESKINVEMDYFGNITIKLEESKSVNT